MSTLPVLSPLPNNVPSTRSAPAISPSSVAATAVPLSLWGCRDRIIFSLFNRLRCIHSIWSAYILGDVISTVAGRLIITLLCEASFKMATTELQTSAA